MLYSSSPRFTDRNKKRNEFQKNAIKMKQKRIEVEYNSLSIFINSNCFFLVNKDYNLDNNQESDEERNVERNKYMYNSMLSDKNNAYNFDVKSNKIAFYKPKKAILKYRNIDKTLTEKFVSKFTDKLQKELDEIKFKEYKSQLLKNEQLRSKIKKFIISYRA